MRWQVAHEIEGDPSWPELRQETQVHGWCADLIRHRAPDGLWDAGLYSPKWTSTFYTLQTLALLGLPSDDERAGASTEILLDQGVHDDGQVSLWKSQTADVCVAGMLLQIAVSFGFGSDPRLQRVGDRLLQQRLPDGGWNCRIGRDTRHSSFHTTLSVLEGLAAIGHNDTEGMEFLLQHELFRSHRTGEIVNPGLLSFSFPRYWYYDVLRALRFFGSVDASPDPRMQDAVSLLRDKRGKDGWWRLGRTHPGKTWLRLETGRRPSALITLDALRVLRWWSNGAAVR